MHKEKGSGTALGLYPFFRNGLYFLFFTCIVIFRILILYTADFNPGINKDVIIYYYYWFEMLFTSSPCMGCKALLVSKNSHIPRSAFCDASRVLTWISSTKDETSISGTLFSICW